MRKRTGNLSSISLALAVLMASDAAMVLAAYLPGSGERGLAAQEASSRHDEEQMFLEARRALNREEFDRASELFQALRSKYHAGRFVPDSYYWEAFGRYRAGDLPEALTLLDLTAVYREAQSNYYDGNMYKTGRLYKDVRDLRLRIQRQQAEKGDSRAAEEVLREAEAVLLADTARLGRTVDRAREARLQRVVKDLQWRADSAMAVQTAWLRADSLARELARRRARSGSATAEANLRRFLEEAERDQSNLEAALTNLLARDWPDSAEAEVGLQSFLAEVARRQGAARTVWQGIVEAQPDMAAPSQADTALAPAVRYIPPQVPEGCQDASVQQEALTALLRLESDQIRSVRSVLEREDACTAHLRHQAVTWLARQGTEEAEGELIGVATSHPDTNTRKWAILGLAEFETSRTVDVLSNILRKSEDDAVKSEAITALRYNPHEEATDALTLFASEDRESEELREEAIAAFGVRLSWKPENVMENFDMIGSEKIMISLLEVLGSRAQSGEREVANWLFQQAANKEYTLNVRTAALAAWSRGSWVDLRHLAESYAELEESPMRERIFYALYRKAESDSEAAPAIIDTMIELARTETDPEVRERAVYWLGRTGSERAAEFLMELLRRPPSPTPSGGSLPFS